ncbi:pyruvate dehydrogenase [Plectosphaerella plurivora]|uniref:Pyruvate dehydrogenase n=1 Tax=Plectosphaerella plurivora TaxID=936078 RepID=A0A9P8V2G3_9PEZI|nr:pyruvate dehydrogenase [Plectosphaerella plurivora]
MQSLHVAPRRLCVRSLLQTRPRRLFSTKPPPSVSSSNGNGSPKNKGYLTIGAAAVVGTSGLWWLTKAKSSSDNVPSLNTSTPTPSPFSPDKVTSTLSKAAYSFSVSSIPGIDRYDGAQVPSNSPCEDRFIHGRFPSPRGDGSEWMAWAVFDGHAGWQTADLLVDELLPAVRLSLSKVIPASTTPETLNAAVQKAVSTAFVDLDDTIMKTAEATTESDLPLQDKMRKLTPGYAGSCALLALFDPLTSTLYVACTGDSRAVLGRKSPSGVWEATPLSVDQNGSNVDEIARIDADHPGEEGIAKGGRILGLAVSRAFGDGRWKWSLELQQDLKQRFQGVRPLTGRYNVLTPPYLTAEPVVTVTSIEQGVPSFLVMASDGLWDFVSSQQAVDLTGKWLETPAPRTKKSGDSSPTPADAKAMNFGQLGDDVSERFVGERTTVEDDNAAVHLVRNALGGNNQQLLAGRLAVEAPFSRNIRDDTTVQVVFFTGNK